MRFRWSVPNKAYLLLDRLFDHFGAPSRLALLGCIYDAGSNSRAACSLCLGRWKRGRERAKQGSKLSHVLRTRNVRARRVVGSPLVPADRLLTINVAADLNGDRTADPEHNKPGRDLAYAL